MPVHATGSETGLGPSGIRDQEPTSAATVVVVEVEALVEGGAAVVEGARLLGPPAQPARRRTARTKISHRLCSCFTFTDPVTHAGRIVLRGGFAFIRAVTVFAKDLMREEDG